MFSPKDLAGRLRNPQLRRIEVDFEESKRYREANHYDTVIQIDLATLPPKPGSLTENSPCWLCSTVFEHPKSRHSGGYNYCSSECKKKAQSLRRGLARQGYKTTTHIVVCMTCRSPFLTITTSVALCSPACAKDYEFDETGLPMSAFVLFTGGVSSAEQLQTLEKTLETVLLVMRFKVVTADDYSFSANYKPERERKFKQRTTTANIRVVKPNEKQHDEFDFLCPTPAKKVYRTEDEAEAFIEQYHPNDAFIRPYKCRCSAIHIGHSYPLFVQRKLRDT